MSIDLIDHKPRPTVKVDGKPHVQVFLHRKIRLIVTSRSSKEEEDKKKMSTALERTGNEVEYNGPC